jgi:flavodoxin
MKALVVYFSRSGHTEQVARAVADALHAELEPIGDGTKRRGLIGYLRSGFEAATRRMPDISPPTHDLSQYDLVVVGTPVWNASVSSPVRAFLTRNRGQLKRVAFFCTMGGRGAERAFREMERASGRRPADVLVVREHDLRGDWGRSIDRFVREVRSVLEPVQRAVPAA